MVSVLAVVAALSLTGCPSEESTVPDGGTGQKQGLTVAWSSTQPIPTTDNPSVTEAILSVRSVRAIGDAAPGDASTTKERFTLRWSKSEAPAPMVFDHAPAGKYAKIDLVLRDDGQDTFKLVGVARINGTDVPYEIEGEEQISISIPLPSSATLPAGGMLTVGVKVNLRDIVKDLNLASVPPQGGVIRINEDTAPGVLAAAQVALASAFRQDDL
jgi:hypothetical protein